MKENSKTFEIRGYQPQSGKHINNGYQPQKQGNKPTSQMTPPSSGSGIKK
ncbi:hypothetical protein [uncultured Clostridium sp.]|nr:hypothetical protein [uncultured Clostridium sp.]